MISKNLARRLERLEGEIAPAMNEPIIFSIIWVSGAGERVDRGIEIKVPAVLKPVQRIV